VGADQDRLPPAAALGGQSVTGQAHLSRRASLLALAGAVGLGLAVSYGLGRSRDVGRYVGDSPSVTRILDDRRSPAVAFGAADVTVVVFTDYQCPVCRRTDPALRAAVARDGNVRLVYKDWPVFGERSRKAAEVALAAHRQGIYPAVHHALMRAPGLDEPTLRRTVETAGGDWTRVEADLARHAPQVAEQLALNAGEAFSLGLVGTPGYLIGPVLAEGALSEDEFRRAFAQARAERSGNR
jgi:protein-disulfide isomerase